MDPVDSGYLRAAVAGEPLTDCSEAPLGLSWALVQSEECIPSFCDNEKSGTSVSKGQRSNDTMPLYSGE